MILILLTIYHVSGGNVLGQNQENKMVVAIIMFIAVWVWILYEIKNAPTIDD